jgi:hypothetical protein
MNAMTKQSCCERDGLREFKFLENISENGVFSFESVFVFAASAAV